MTPLLAALAVLALFAGAAALTVGLRPAPVDLAKPAARAAALETKHGRVSPRTRQLLLAGLLAGVLAWLVSGWFVAVLVLPAAAAGLPVLLAKNSAGSSIARLEAMEEWTRSLAGMLGVGIGLEQAIIATLRSTPDAIRPEVATLIARLRARWDTASALRAFADDLDDATGDLIAASLLLAAGQQGNGLVSVLQGLAATVADDVRIRRAVEAERQGTRTTARAVSMITVGVLVAWMLFRRSYIAPYGTPVGQVVLLLLLSGYVGALLWLRQITLTPKLPRFIGQHLSGQDGPA